MGRPKKKPEEKGHEIERYGYRIHTSPLEDGGWLAKITPKGKSDGAKLPSIEKDGFRFQGEALDWGEDWAQQHRPYVASVAAYDNGFEANVVDENGLSQYRTVGCSEASEAQKIADSWIAARRRHDLQVIEARQRARADYRMTLDDLQVAEDEAQAAIDVGKTALRVVEKGRELAKLALRDPQIEFNFVAELERRGALRDVSPQTDLEDRLGGAANDGSSRARGAAGRARPEAPAT